MSPPSPKSAGRVQSGTLKLTTQTVRGVTAEQMHQMPMVSLPMDVAQQLQGAGTGSTPPTAPQEAPGQKKKDDKSGSGDKPGTGASIAGPQVEGQAGAGGTAPAGGAGGAAQSTKDAENPFGVPWWRAYESLSSRDALNKHLGGNGSGGNNGSGSGSGGTGPQAAAGNNGKSGNGSGPRGSGGNGSGGNGSNPGNGSGAGNTDKGSGAGDKSGGNGSGGNGSGGNGSGERGSGAPPVPSWDEATKAEAQGVRPPRVTSLPASAALGSSPQVAAGKQASPSHTHGTLAGSGKRAITQNGMLMLPMVSLQLGRWWRLAALEGEIWCCMNNKDEELVWKVVEKEGERPSSFMIHAPYRHIRAVRFHTPAHGCQVLEIDTAACPTFSTERVSSSCDLTPTESGFVEPPRPPQREPSLDFTGGFAASERTHRAVFPSGCLGHHIHFFLASLKHLINAGQVPPASPALHPGLPFGIPGLATLAATMQSRTSAENTLITMARLLQQLGIQQQLQAFDLVEQETPSVDLGLVGAGSRMASGSLAERAAAAEKAKKLDAGNAGSSGDGTNGRNVRTEIGANFLSSHPGSGRGNGEAGGKVNTVIGANFSKNGNGSSGAGNGSGAENGSGGANGSGAGNGHSGSAVLPAPAPAADEKKLPGRKKGHSGGGANFSEASHDHGMGGNGSGGSGNGASSIHPVDRRHHPHAHPRLQPPGDGDTNTTGNGHGNTATSHLRRSERRGARSEGQAGRVCSAHYDHPGQAGAPGGPPAEGEREAEAVEEEGAPLAPPLAAAGGAGGQGEEGEQEEEPMEGSAGDAQRNESSGDPDSHQEKVGERGSREGGGSGANGSGEGAGASNQLGPNQSGNADSPNNSGGKGVRAASSHLREGQGADREEAGPLGKGMALREKRKLGALGPAEELEGAGGRALSHGPKQAKHAGPSGVEAAPVRVHHHKTSLGKRVRAPKPGKLSDEDTASSGIEDIPLDELGSDADGGSRALQEGPRGEEAASQPGDSDGGAGGGSGSGSGDGDREQPEQPPAAKAPKAGPAKQPPPRHPEESSPGAGTRRRPQKDDQG